MVICMMRSHLVSIVPGLTMGIRIWYIGIFLVGLIGILRIVEMVTVADLQNLILLFFSPLLLVGITRDII